MLRQSTGFRCGRSLSVPATEQHRPTPTQIQRVQMDTGRSRPDVLYKREHRDVYLRVPTQHRQHFLTEQLDRALGIRGEAHREHQIARAGRPRRPHLRDAIVRRARNGEAAAKIIE